jgi:hypothetical protein
MNTLVSVMDLSVSPREISGRSSALSRVTQKNSADGRRRGQILGQKSSREDKLIQGSRIGLAIEG